MIVLVGSIAAGIIVALLLFAFAYTRMLGGNQEQKTAIEAAALAAAKDLSRIVMEDPHFGWVGLSDYAPVGNVTKAPDGYLTPVTSINTILGTIRLDMIIADEIPPGRGGTKGITQWKNLANIDYQKAMTCKDNLNALLQASLTPAGYAGAKDVNGQQVIPYKSAEDAYKQNQIRMTGGSAYVTGSLNLTLGCLNGGSETTVQAPQKNNQDYKTSPTQNNKYLSYTDYPYNGKSFIFAGAGSQIKLVDSKNFTTNVPLTYSIRSIVKAEAQQKFFENGNTAVARVVKAMACAQPACVPDPRPAPGIYAIDFPDGKVTEIDTILSMLTHQYLNGGNNPADFSWARNGDYIGPGGTSSLQPATSADWPGGAKQEPAVGVGGGTYDWVRRGGPKVKIDSLIAAINGSGLPSTAFQTVSLHKYIIGPNGDVYVNWKPANKEPYIALSDDQLYMQCADAMEDIESTQVVVNGVPTTQNVVTAPWTLYEKDEVRQWGDTNGGQHAGAPLAVTGTILAYDPTDKWIACTPRPLADSAICMNGNKGIVKLGDFGGEGLGANCCHTCGSTNLQVTTPLTLGTFDDWATQGEQSVTYQFTAGAPAPAIMPPIYLQNGAAVHFRWRREDVSLNGGTVPKQGHRKK